MKVLTIFPFLLFGFLSFTGCSDQSTDNNSSDDYLIFGRFYGFCVGEECIEIFKITNSQIFEDQNDNYPQQSGEGNNFYDGNFNELPNEAFSLANQIQGTFPLDLIAVESGTVFGQPDAADQGGIYVEYKWGDIHKYWVIDNAKNNVPEYLYDFMDEVHRTVGLINQNLEED